MDTENPVVIEVAAPPIVDEADDFLSDTDLGEGGDEVPPEETAAQIIAAARAEAEQILTDAQAEGIAEQAALRLAAQSEIAVLLEQAKADGYAEGMTAATREGDEIRAQARAILADAEAERIARMEALEPEMVNLLLGIADKLIGNAVALNPQVILSLVRMGMQSATITGEVKIYVSADDYATVIASKDELTALIDGSVTLDIVKDPSLSAMDCMIETPFGNVDASLNQQFETLKQNITYLLNG